MTDDIQFMQAGGLATVTLNRPEKMNAFILPMYQRFGEIFDQLNADDSVRKSVV